MSKFHYEPGEREESVTSPGKKKREALSDKVVVTLSNFAVRKYELKPEHNAALAELFRDLFLGRSCATHALSSAEGYTDAVDDEALNTKLREARAVYVATLIEELCKRVNPQFKPSAESRAAPAGTYLNPRNDTPEARADNRAVRIELKRLPQELFFQVRQHPDEFNKQKETCGVVNAEVWERGEATFGGLTIRGRKLWAARTEPIWANEVVYYNTHAKPLAQFLNQMIVVHHTSNDDSLMKNEQKQQKKGYAALGYHFAIAQDGRIFEGRPLAVMGSHAGEGLTPGPLNDPDWGAVGIVMMGDFDGTVFYDDPTPAMLDSLEKLVRALVNWSGCKVLAMHKEVIRKGDPTVCPGNHMYGPVEDLRKKLGMSAPAAPAGSTSGP
jgi:outer membrane protein OmpA-like peptidoglycan-associated protein